MPLAQADDAGGNDPARPSHDVVRALTQRARLSHDTSCYGSSWCEQRGLFRRPRQWRAVGCARLTRWAKRSGGAGTLALNQARAYGAPVPEVIFADTTRHEYPAPYMVMRRLPGVPAFEVSLTPRTRATILKQSGRHLLAIHSIPLAGFGYLELQNGVYIGRSSSWWAYVREEGERRLTKLPTAILPPPMAAAIERRFEQTRTKRELDQAVLLHGDYQLKNILV